MFSNKYHIRQVKAQFAEFCCFYQGWKSPIWRHLKNRPYVTPKNPLNQRMVNRNPPKRYVTASPRFPALLSGLIKACQAGFCMGLMGPKIHQLDFSRQSSVNLTFLAGQNYLLNHLTTNKMCSNPWKTPKKNWMNSVEKSRGYSQAASQLGLKVEGGMQPRTR